jgi:hypothetical protein
LARKKYQQSFEVGNVVTESLEWQAIHYLMNLEIKLKYAI